MKRKVSILLVIILIISLAPLHIFANDNITVILNGERVNFDVQPQIINNRVMVPMRAIFEKLGMEVTFDKKVNWITASNSNTFIGMTVGKNKILVNLDVITIDTPPVIRNNRTLVPLRAISESLDMDVSWDSLSRTVTIIKNKKIDYNYKYNVLCNIMAECQDGLTYNAEALLICTRSMQDFLMNNVDNREYSHDLAISNINKSYDKIENAIKIINYEENKNNNYIFSNIKDYLESMIPKYEYMINIEYYEKEGDYRHGSIVEIADCIDDLVTIYNKIADEFGNVDLN